MTATITTTATVATLATRTTPATPAPFARTAAPTQGYTSLATSAETGGAFACGLVCGPQGSEPPPHVHTREHEMFYLLDGTVIFYAGGETLRAEAGDFVFLPKGAAHTFRIVSDTATALVFVTPGGFERYFMADFGDDREAGYEFTKTLGIEFVDWQEAAVPPTSGPRPYVRRAALENTRLFMGHTLKSFLANGAETGGTVGLVEAAVRRGAEPPPHIHHHEAELFYVLDGSVTFTVGGEQLRSLPGTFVYLPQGVPHAFSVRSDTARLLVGVLPGGFERLFAELSGPAASLALPTAPVAAPTSEQIERMLAISAKYGIEYVM